LLVPTWSIETWLVQLCGALGPTDETRSLKHDAAFRTLWDENTAKPATITAAVAAWRGPSPASPSLADAYAEEARRVWL
jgi:hypothetical protein